MNIKNTINSIKTNRVKLYRNSMLKTIYFAFCLLLIGLYLSCAGEKSSDGGTSPSINYGSLGIASFSVVDSNDVPISDTNTNAIPLDASFLLTFDQSLGELLNNDLKSQIKFTDMGGGPIGLSIKATPPNQIKITPENYLRGDTIYQLILNKDLIIGNYQLTNSITYFIRTDKQYQVRFYQGGSLLGTVSVANSNAIPASDYPTPSTEKQLYKWYSDDSLTQVYDKNALVTNDLALYSEILTTVGSFKSIIDAGIIPADLANYDDMSKTIFSNYIAGADVIARYVKETGSGNGSSWANASGDIQAMVDGINDASENKVYVVLVASGTYKPNASYSMKNHVALVGGFTAGNYDQSGETRLDGTDNKRLFHNLRLNRTASLYGVVITNGNISDGGGMYNWQSSPTLINVTFSGNTTSTGRGGGMFNYSSSPTLIDVTFSGNTAHNHGGGMYNDSSSPTLINVTFSGNTASTGSGGGMHNLGSSSVLINATFSGNTANVSGGGMYNESSDLTLMMNITFSDNTAHNDGGGMFNYSSSPTLINVTFSGNTASTGRGGGMFNNRSSPTLINSIFSGNKDNGNMGGIYHDGNGGQGLTLINTILWGNDNGSIYLENDFSGDTDKEIVNLYYSLIEGGTTPSTTATGIRLSSGDTNTYLVEINSRGVIDDNPGLGPLANYGGEVNTISIGSSSPSKDTGVYVRGMKNEVEILYPETNLYYSKNQVDWYSDPGLTTQESPPSDADDLTATDARGYGRVGRPDMGAYEVDGVAP